MFRERQKEKKNLKIVVLPWCELLELVGSFWGGEIRRVFKLEGVRLGLGR